MNTRRFTHRPVSGLWIACTVFVLLLSACQSGSRITSQPPVQPAETALATQAPAEATQPEPVVAGPVSLDLANVAQAQTIETVPAVPGGEEHPFWEVFPEHTRVTLQGYPVANHLMKPQIFIYPVAGLAGSNEAAAQTAVDLQTWLQNQQLAQNMPFLPFFNASQVMHTQVQALDFKNGKGVRFLTQFDQAPLPVNNFELIYTFQGLTHDGKTYVAAVLPLTHPELPASQQVSPEQAAEMSDFPAYLAQTVTWLEQQPGESFTPSLAQLDALIQSLEVK